MIKTQLFSKQLGLTIKNVAKLGEFRVPKKAVTYDRVLGTSKKGDFDIITFRNAEGKIIKRGTTYLDSEGNNTHIVKNFGKAKKGLRISKSVKINGVEYLFTTTRFIKREKKNNKLLKFIKNIFNFPFKRNNKKPNELFGIFKYTQEITNLGETASAEFLSRGAKPRCIEWKYNYDGNIPELRYKNINTKVKLTKDEAKYLPVILSDLSNKRVTQKLDYLQMLQEKLYGLQGLVPKVKLVKFKELNPNIKEVKTLTAGRATWFNGQVEILDQFKNEIIPLVTAFAHEYKHVNDFINMLRVYDPEIIKSLSPVEMKQICDAMEKAFPGINAYQDKCVATKGYIMPDNEEWQTLKELSSFLTDYKYDTVAEHDALELEKRANLAGKKEQQYIRDLLKKITLVLKAKPE